MKRDDPNANEVWEENYRAAAIKDLFNYQTGWDAWTAYGSLTDKTHLQNTIVSRQQNDVWATDFWVGDFCPVPIQGQDWVEGWYWTIVWIDWLEVWYPAYVYGWHWEPGQYVIHQSYYGSGIDSTQDIKDTDLYAWTNYPYSKQMFTFSWTCSCANVTQPYSPYYGYYDTYCQSGIIGMPLAWTSNWDMNINGYNYPNTDYCYIGFDGASHPLIDLVYGTNYHYTDFPRAFYEKLLGFEDYGAHQTVKDSLDHASQVIWGTSWWYTPFSLTLATIFTLRTRLLHFKKMFICRSWEIQD